MYKNYLKIAFRNLIKHRMYAFLNVAGLAIGLTCFILIMLFVRDELSFDSYPEHADDIYRIALDIKTSQGEQKTAQSPTAWGSVMEDEYPEVVNFTRFKPPQLKWLVGYDDIRFYEKNWTFSDSTVFEMFSMPLLRGNPKSALNAPWTVVLSEEMARKYFQDQDPIGKIIELDNQYDFAVTGVMKNPAHNAHFHFDFLASIQTLQDSAIYFDRFLERQGFPFIYTYIQLEENYPAAEFETKIPGYLEKHVYSSSNYFAQTGTEITARLQPLRDIHLYSNRDQEIEPNGDINTVYVFLAIAVFIMLIACINFMNLATARSSSRAKEVGMRKVVGASRGQLIQQFFGESLLLAFIALIFALILIEFALPEFNAIIGRQIGFGYLDNWLFLIGLVGVTFLAGLLAGSYPAFFLSAFRPVMVLKGGKGSTAGGRSPLLRKALITFQFVISIVLIIGTGIVYQQMEFIRNKKLGFDKDQIVTIQLSDPAPRSLYQTYRNAILQENMIVEVSASSSAPASLLGQNTMRPDHAAADETWIVQSYLSDYEFIETLGINVIAGRNFSRDYLADTLSNEMGGVILNKTAAEAFGWQNPEEAVNEHLRFSGAGNNNGPNPLIRIVGVVEDFHSHSIHRRIEPTVMFLGPNPQNYQYLFVRIRADQAGSGAAIRQVIEVLRNRWMEIIPEYAFEYSFLDEDFNRLYKTEDILGKIFGTFAALTIFIACLGLFGLASFTAEQRTKEIGVRKALGASSLNIVFHLCKEFSRLIVLAFLVAAPLAYYVLNRWLEDFAYRTDINLLTFLIAGIIAFVIALLTISYQAIKAALANPVDALRYE